MWYSGSKTDYSFITLNMLSHCFLAYIVSGEKSTVNLFGAPLYVMDFFFSRCFHDFVFVFGFQCFLSDVSMCRIILLEVL